METSAAAGGLIVPKRMLKPCANIKVFPGLRCGSMASRYSLGCLVSGTRIMMTSAQAAASAGLLTVKPSFSAFAREALQNGKKKLDGQQDRKSKTKENTSERQKNKKLVSRDQVEK